MIAGRGQWNAELIQSIFTTSDAAAILTTPISKAGLQDRLVWHHSRKGNFTVASAYSWLLNSSPLSQHAPESSNSRAANKSMWKRLWGMNIKGKIKHFLWRAWHRILPTNDQLLRKGSQIDALCKTCGEADETLEHMLFHCPKARIIWQLSPVNWSGLHHLAVDFQAWWQQLCRLGSQDIHCQRIELTSYILWSIWKMRNEWLFNGTNIT